MIDRTGDAEIQITDWQHEPIQLNVTEGSTVNILGLKPSGPPMPLGRLEDFVPRRFRQVVLCAGPVDAAWPSDLTLMERLLRPPADMVIGRPWWRGGGLSARALVCLLGSSAALLGCFAAAVVSFSSRAEARRQAEPLVGRVYRAIQATKVTGVIARKEQDRVVVEGLVDSSADAARLRAALHAFPGDRVQQKFASGTEVAQAMADALANPGLTVHYRGDGDFAVLGSAQNLDQVRASLKRIATDLGPLVGRIQIEAKELPPPRTVPVGALLAGDELSYVQTRDGTKHMTVVTPPPVDQLTGTTRGH
jgi:type III secretion protein D